MPSVPIKSVEYEVQNGQVSWQGVSIAEGELFETFLTTDVASRLYDEEEANEFEADLRGLTNTGFASDSLRELLSAEIAEDRDWAVGEAMAEAYLTHEHGITWPWNMARDKRTPRASLPGADLVGFKVNDTDVRLTLGEVKTSADIRTPPNVMNGRSGMEHQIDNLACDPGLVCQLIKWLHPRCKITGNEALFKVAIKLFLNSGNKAVSLFGVLIRDTEPNEHDLKARGQTLAGNLQAPATCQLIALYLPCAIVDLPTLISGGES